MDRKSEEYIKRSERAASEIATWPKWMQRNLQPTKVSIPEVSKKKQASQSEQR
jgi:hypothetical protein